MLRAQTRGNFGISEVFVTLDDEVATNPEARTQPEWDLTQFEDVGGPLPTPPKDILLM